MGVKTAATVYGFTLLVVGACSSSPDVVRKLRTGDGLLRQVDSIVLTESDTFVVAKPVGFTVGANRQYFVSDAASASVAEFASNGDFVRAFGARGSGPGEFRTPTTLGISGDSLIVVMDFATARLSMWSLSSFEMVRQLQLPGKPWSVEVASAGIFAGYYDVKNTGAVAVWDADEASFRMIGPIHKLFTRVPQSSSLFGQNAVSVSGDTVATAFEISNYVYLHRVDGQVLDSLELPRVARAGAQTALLDRIVASDPTSAYPALYKSSLPLTLGQLSSGILVLVSADPAMINGRATGAMYVSLVDFARRATCVDARLTVPADPLPRAELRGDTLYVLAQHLTEDDQVQTVVHVFAVDANSCDWNRGR